MWKYRLNLLKKCFLFLSKVFRAAEEPGADVFCRGRPSSLFVIPRGEGRTDNIPTASATLNHKRCFYIFKICIYIYIYMFFKISFKASGVIIFIFVRKKAVSCVRVSFKSFKKVFFVFVKSEVELRSDRGAVRSYGGLRGIARNC